MRKTTTLNGAAGKGKSKPFSSTVSFIKPVLAASILPAFCLAMLMPSLASSPLIENSRSERQLPKAEPEQMVPLARYASVPSEGVSTSSIPTPPPVALPVAIPAELIAPIAPPAPVEETKPAQEAKPIVNELPPTKVKGAFPRGLHPVIKHAMVEASRYLPEGWQLEFMNALRDAPGVWNGPHGKRDHTGGALAVDVWLVNPKGERLCNFKCTQNFEPYQTFMQMVKHIQDRDFPAYRNQGRWGGYFGGSYANDEMHYDLEPSAWTAAGNWEKGLFPAYAYFGKKSDVGKGMGSIAAYRLPESGTLASLETPVQQPGAAPAATKVASNTPSATNVAAATVRLPARPSVQAPVVQKVAAAVPARTAHVRKANQHHARAHLPRQPRFVIDEDGEWQPVRAQRRFDGGYEEAEAPRVRYAQNRYGRRGARTMRDYGDD